MAVYRTCTRLFPGSHLPHLYIGMENLRTNSLATAQLNFQTAHDLGKADPLVLNELGVAFYKRRLYSEAREYFLRALDLASESESWVKETVLCNIGHSLRKAGDHKAALGYFEKAHLLNPRDGAILFALAFTAHISHQLTRAIRYYYKVALSHQMAEFQSDNMFAADMMTRCLGDISTLPLEATLQDN